MQRVRSLIFLVLLIIFACLLISEANAGNARHSLYNEYLTDSDGWNYGITFYVDNNTGSALYIEARITSRSNVVGNVIHGQLLLQPSERHVAVGSFKCADDGEAWSVNIQTRETSAD